MIKAISVVANDDFSIVVSLENGETVKMDLSFILNESGPVVEPLKDKNEFSKVFVRNGIVTWHTGYDIDPYYLIEQSTSVEQTG